MPDFKLDESVTAGPWYRDGLSFQCTQCGNCCTGAPGVVFVKPAEQEAIAKAIGLTHEEFRLKHTRSIGRKVTLTEKANGDCTFFDGLTRRCTIYAVRPEQCRTWPFWNSNLESRDDWEAAEAVCPGTGKGKWFSLEEIQKLAAVVDI